MDLTQLSEIDTIAEYSNLFHKCRACVIKPKWRFIEVSKTIHRPKWGEWRHLL